MCIVYIPAISELLKLGTASQPQKQGFIIIPFCGNYLEKFCQRLRSKIKYPDSIYRFTIEQVVKIGMNAQNQTNLVQVLNLGQQVKIGQFLGL